MDGTWVTNNCDKLLQKSLNHFGFRLYSPQFRQYFHWNKIYKHTFRTEFWVFQPGVMALMRRLTVLCLSAAGRSHRVNRLGKHPDKKPRHHAGQYTIVTPTVGDEETRWPILSLPGVKQTCKQCLTMFGKVEYELYLLLIFPNIVILIWWRWPKVDQWKPYCR